MIESSHEALLEPKLVGKISGRFYVPAYQRGYRWGRVEVRKLLDDIWESRDRPYYLQPIVVKRREDEWILVDGQQRLTTLFLIFQYMKNNGLQNATANYSIRYETRAGSAEYLKSPVGELSQENIDFFHIHEAYACIRDWFEELGEDPQYVAVKLYIAFFEHVKVIWYEAPEDLDETTLFTRLNVGRIPLTDAELVKALLLTEIRKVPGTTDRALETAVEWDSMERDLRDPELWAFITGSSAGVPTHISLLLDTLAGGPTGRERPLFHTFETLRELITNDPLAFWRRVVDLHSLVMGWYDSRDLFHKIGFLVAEGVTTLGGLIPLAQGKAKSAFEGELTARVREHLNQTESALRDLTYASTRAERVLLLMNVETIRQRRHSSERYSFREHASGRWSLEHIHAQNAQQLPRRTEVWETWLRLHRRALASTEAVGGAAGERLLSRVDGVLANPPIKGTDFDSLERQLTEMLSLSGDPAAVDVHSISNLALLDGGDNSALSNSVFAVKRTEILTRDRDGSYVPVCTRNAFLKYYSPSDEHQAHFWSADDRGHYLDAMVEVIRCYLLPEEVES